MNLNTQSPLPVHANAVHHERTLKKMNKLLFTLLHPSLAKP